MCTDFGKFEVKCLFEFSFSPFSLPLLKCSLRHFKSPDNYVVEEFNYWVHNKLLLWILVLFAEEIS